MDRLGGPSRFPTLGIRLRDFEGITSCYTDNYVLVSMVNNVYIVIVLS